MPAACLRALLCGGGACALVLLVHCGPAPNSAGSPAATHAAEAAYVGAARCASCHPQEHQAWQGSHHDLAMQEPDESSVLGDFSGVDFQHFATTAHFFRRDAGWWVRTQGASGELEEFAVRYTFGVFPLQQYLVEAERGRLQVLPFCWDARPAADGGQRWYHLYADEPIPPGDLLHWTGREQNWNSMCAECHSTGLTRGYDPDADSFQTRWHELDVSCEACHGPGAAHAAWAERGGTTTERLGSEPPYELSVDLADRSGGAWQFVDGLPTRVRSTPPVPDRALDACAPCHARRRPLVDGALPGGALLDTHQLEWIRDPLYFPDGQIRDEVYVHGSFLQSRMHAAGVRCTDCHEPHSLRLRAPGNALCTQCHDPQVFDREEHHFHPAGGPGAGCIDCHMPERTYMGIDQRRDHSFRVPRPDLSPLTGAPDTCTSCHQDRSAAWASEAITAARDGDRSWQKPHFGPIFAAAWSGVPGAQEALAGLALEPSLPGIVRGSALEALAAAPARLRLPAAAQALRDPDPLVRLAALRSFEDTEAQVRGQVLAGLDQDPVRAVRVEAARILAANPTDPELAEAYAASAERPETWLNCGIFARAQGQLDEAQAAYERALALEPRFAAAAVNLADLHRERGAESRGRAVLEATLAADPQAASVHHALGLLLVRQAERERALDHLQRAARLAPEDARYAFVAAVALHDAGQPSLAASALEAALTRHPRDFDMRSFYLTILFEQGERQAATEQLEVLESLFPEDRRVAALRQRFTR